MIRGVIDEMVGEEQSRFFVGRAVETAVFKQPWFPLTVRAGWLS